MKSHLRKSYFLEKWSTQQDKMYSEELILPATSENIYISICFGTNQIAFKCFYKRGFVSWEIRSLAHSEKNVYYTLLRGMRKISKYGKILNKKMKISLIPLQYYWCIGGSVEAWRRWFRLKIGYNFIKKPILIAFFVIIWSCQIKGVEIDLKMCRILLNGVYGITYRY